MHVNNNKVGFEAVVTQINESIKIELDKVF
jgi:hypothetical protein